WQPLFEYARRRSRDEATASDSVQAFIARLIEKDSPKVADAERGRFGSVLTVSLKRFLQHPRVHTQD
ncbi:MAG: RNA polymerase subunit sigma-24, partial [Planctomycetaceae bacterium]|nr:RNA polymerase subunit sigma-24 [Planctomycetaceae bacterium]